MLGLITDKIVKFPYLRHMMDNTGWLDWIAGGLAIAILLGGMVMLAQGVSAMNKK